MIIILISLAIAIPCLFFCCYALYQQPTLIIVLLIGVIIARIIGFLIKLLILFLARNGIPISTLEKLLPYPSKEFCPTYTHETITKKQLLKNFFTICWGIHTEKHRTQLIRQSKKIPSGWAHHTSSWFNFGPFIVIQKTCECTNVFWEWYNFKEKKL